MNRCALLSFNCGETVLEGPWNQAIRVQHKQKRRENLGFFFFNFLHYKITNLKMLESVRILKTQFVRGRNIITKLNCDKTQTEKKLIFSNVDQTN